MPNIKAEKSIYSSNLSYSEIIKTFITLFSKYAKPVAKNNSLF